MPVINFRKIFTKFIVSIITLMLCLVILFCSPVAVVLTQSYFARGNGIIWLNDVRCTGRESRLTDCQHSIFADFTSRYSIVSCNHNMEVGTMCFNGSGL